MQPEPQQPEPQETEDDSPWMEALEGSGSLPSLTPYDAKKDATTIIRVEDVLNYTPDEGGDAQGW